MSYSACDSDWQQNTVVTCHVDGELMRANLGGVAFMRVKSNKAGVLRALNSTARGKCQVSVVLWSHQWQRAETDSLSHIRSRAPRDNWKVNPFTPKFKRTFSQKRMSEVVRIDSIIVCGFVVASMAVSRNGERATR